MRRAVMLCVIMLLTIPKIWAQASNDELRNEVLKLVNEHRAEMNLPALQMKDDISKAATIHSGNMASHKIPLSHEGFDERVGGLMKKYGAHGGAENVVDGAKTAQKALDLWLHSPGHRKNIEGNFNLTGIGIATASDGTIYITQIFINTQ